MNILESKNVVKTIQIITKILDTNNIIYWIDCGVLLGILRNGKFIPYDSDVDMCIFAKEKELENICKIFAKEKIKAFISDDPNTPIHFEKKDGYGFEYVVLAHFRTNTIVRFLSIILCRIPTNMHKKIVRIIQQYYSTNEMVRLKTTEGREKNLFCRLARAMLPILFCGSFLNKKFYDFNVRIPERAEELMMMRYGNDWRIPKKRGEYIPYTTDH